VESIPHAQAAVEGCVLAFAVLNVMMFARPGTNLAARDERFGFSLSAQRCPACGQ
jgi:hypothetical protein